MKKLSKYIFVFFILLYGCEGYLKEINDLATWTLETKPNFDLPETSKPLSSSTLTSIVRLKYDSGNKDSDDDDFIEEDINASKVMAIINVKGDPILLSDDDIERLYYIAQAQIYENFKVIIVSEGDAINTKDITSSIKQQLLSFDVDPSYIQVMFDNSAKKDFLRVKILR